MQGKGRFSQGRTEILFRVVVEHSQRVVNVEVILNPTSQTDLVAPSLSRGRFDFSLVAVAGFVPLV
jgi:hypothetical protein